MKRIILLSDGTGNSSAKLFKTNVWRLYQSLDLETETDGVRQIACYSDGVGTSSFRPLAILGGAFGYGLKRNILHLYDFLCRHWEPGDEIWLFGFSRGAFTVRVLAGMIASEGVLRGASGADLSYATRDIYRHFRWSRAAAKGIEEPPLARSLRLRPRRLHPRVPDHDAAAGLPPAGLVPGPHIRFVGVWDTVAAYGSPLAELTLGIDKWIFRLSMPDRKLHEHVETARHALCLDDERDTFHPLIWDEVETDRPERIKQVWFAGVHSDLGGGYPDDALSVRPLDWMKSEAGLHGLTFLPDAAELFAPPASHSAVLHDSRHGLAGYYRYQPRRLSAYLRPDDPQAVLMVDPRPGTRAHLREVLLHRSVIDRIGDRASRYAPIVLPAAFRVVERCGRITANPETPAQAAARMAGQEEVWDDVWLRRMYYRLTLLTSLLLASLPFWGAGGKAEACEPAWCAISPLFRALGYVVPAIGQYWTTAFADNPGVTACLIVVLLALLHRASALQQRLRDRMNTLLDGLRPSAAVPASPASPPVWVRRIRCARWTLGVAKVMKWTVWPSVTGLSGLAILGLAGALVVALPALRHLIANQETGGGLCGEKAVTASERFETRLTCWDTRDGGRSGEDLPGRTAGRPAVVRQDHPGQPAGIRQFGAAVACGLHGGPAAAGDQRRVVPAACHNPGERWFHTRAALGVRRRGASLRRTTSSGPARSGLSVGERCRHPGVSPGGPPLSQQRRHRRCHDHRDRGAKPMTVLRRAAMLLGCAVLAGCAALTPGSQIVASNVPGGQGSTPLIWRVDPACMRGEAAYAHVTAPTREALAEACRRRTAQATNASPPARDLVALALSGGGTKASTFAAESMFYLDAIGLLKRASMLSSVSGGSFAAAYYALSCEPDQADCMRATARGVVRPVWAYDEAMPILQSGFRPMLVRAGLNFLAPGVKTPVPVETFASFIDGRYLRRPGSNGPPALFADLNPRRPLLVLNSTLLSGGRELAETTKDGGFLRRRTADEFLHFAYTDYYFNRIGSDLRSLELGYGVASSSAFPALIGYAALKNYRCRELSGAAADCADQPKTMLTLTDGGANDNQGLVEVFATMAELAAGEARSDLSRAGHVSPRLERMRAGDRALILVLNSSITETTGVDQPGDRDFLLGTISRASAAVDAYSAVAFNLRKQLYALALERLRARDDRLKLRDVEIGLTTLNRYDEGGAELATIRDAGVLGDTASPEEARLQTAQLERQRSAFAHVSGAERRSALKLGTVHPQCLFEQAKLVEKSVTGLAHLSSNGANCLRWAARWSTALRGEELCQSGFRLADPDADHCSNGHLRALPVNALGALEACRFTEDSAADVTDVLTTLRRTRGFMEGAEARMRRGRSVPAPAGDAAMLEALCTLDTP